MITYVDLKLVGFGGFVALCDTNDMTPDERLIVDAMDGELLQIDGHYTVEWLDNEHYDVVINAVVVSNGKLTMDVQPHEMEFGELAYEIENLLGRKRDMHAEREALAIDKAYKGDEE